MSRLAKTTFYMLVLSLTALCLAGIYKNRVTAQNGINQDVDAPWPQGKWAVSVVPDPHQKENALVPVIVVRTTTSTNKGKDNALEQVILLNRSTKAVSEVKLSYVIHKIETPDAILYRGAQFEVKAKKGNEKYPLQANKRWVYGIPYGRLARFLKPVVKDGSLSGDFVIRLGVTEVIFEDGTVWKDQGALGLNHKPKRPFLQSTCPNSVCKVPTETNPNICEVAVPGDPVASAGYPFYCLFLSGNCTVEFCPGPGETYPDQDGDTYPADIDCMMATLTFIRVGLKTVLMV